MLKCYYSIYILNSKEKNKRKEKQHRLYNYSMELFLELEQDIEMPPASDEMGGTYILDYEVCYEIE